jgi:hypothetical protein
MLVGTSLGCCTSGKVVAIAIPGVEQEVARDLVRAREDVHGDLMSARHGVSKLLLGQGIVYYQGKALSRVHDRWLGSQSFTSPGLQLALHRLRHGQGFHWYVAVR